MRKLLSTTKDQRSKAVCQDLVDEVFQCQRVRAVERCHRLIERREQWLLSLDKSQEIREGLQQEGILIQAILAPVTFPNSFPSPSHCLGQLDVYIKRAVYLHKDLPNRSRRLLTSLILGHVKNATLHQQNGSVCFSDLIYIRFCTGANSFEQLLSPTNHEQPLAKTPTNNMDRLPNQSQRPKQGAPSL